MRGGCVLVFGRLRVRSVGSSFSFSFFLSAFFWGGKVGFRVGHEG